MQFKVAFYKGTRPGLAGLANRIGRWLDHGPYSHAELIFHNGMSGSASVADHGVRIKYIGYSSNNWDFVNLPNRLHDNAYQWFINHRNIQYDMLGNINAAFGFISQSEDKWFCSESIAAALGLEDPWRYKPNGLHAVLKELQ